MQEKIMGNSMVCDGITAQDDYFDHSGPIVRRVLQKDRVLPTDGQP